MTLITYDGVADLFQTDGELFQEVLQAMPFAAVLQQLVHTLWFSPDTRTIWVVCPQIRHPGEYAEPSSLDYTYLDNLGDTDALLEVMVFLSRFYPSATIEKFSAADLPRGHANSNLVVIGGPGNAEEISNPICREMMTAVGSSVSYSGDCDRMLIATPGSPSRELRAEIHSEEVSGRQSGRFSLRRDHGYFARFPNPLNAAATVVLINGIHTAGVLGAARAFADRRDGLRNFHAVLGTQTEPLAFECTFDVDVLHGDVRVPAVATHAIHTLGAPLHPDGRLAQGATPVDDGSLGSSVTILFVAGDRGGGQRNQIQIPREFESIQGALRGSKHRDAISLAAPILAATYQKLAEAYRQRPAILHFAGHGDNRGLSVLLDQGVVVTDVPLHASRLAATLGNFTDRIRLCVLNACDSESVARQLVELDSVDAALGWPGKLTDSAAITFSSTLYGCLGDGVSLSRSAALATQSCAVDRAPTLFARTDSIRESSIFLEGGGG